MSNRNHLTKELLKKICDGIRRTTTIRMACAMAGISESGFHKWQSKGRGLLDEYENMEDIPKKDQIYVELVEQVQRAIQLSCLPAIDSVMKAIKQGDVKAAERLLARRLPDEFGDYNRKEITVKGDISGDDGTGIAMIPTMSSEIDGDLEAMIQQQQVGAKQLAHNKTKLLKDDQ